MDQNKDEKKKQQQEPEKPEPFKPMSDSPLGEDFLSDLGLEEAVEGFISDSPKKFGEFESLDSLTTDEGTIELKIDEELDSAIDEEAKMFLADKHFRAGEFYEALIPALELNIRVRQGRTKRDDMIVKRQDEILFESNYNLGIKHLKDSEKAKGDMVTHHKLMALMHIYGAIDQSFQKGQEDKRKELGKLWHNLIYGYRFGQYYMKTGLFSKVTVPGPEDNGSKAEFWSYMGQHEQDALAKEMFMLMAYGYDLAYFRYQIRLAQFYLESGRIREGIRYIQIPLPGIEDDGIQFLQILKKKDANEYDRFVSKEFNKDVARLKDLRDHKEFSKMFDIMNDWRFRLNTMKTDVPFKDTTLRIEYLKAFSDIVAEINKSNPTHFLDEVTHQIKTSRLANKVPIVQEFAFLQIFYNMEINEKSKAGLNVFDVDSESFNALSYAIEEYLEFMAFPDKKKKDQSEESFKTSISKALRKFQGSLSSKGYKLHKEPRFFY